MQDTTVEVPHFGKDVQVRPIPPTIQRVIHAKATKGGKIDFQELMVWKLVHGLKDPNFTEAEAREITQRFSLRTLRPIIDQIDCVSGTDEHLQGADQLDSVRKITEPAMIATSWLRRFPDVAPAGARSRESHGAKPVRHRGSRRGTRAASSSSDDPEPEPGGRACEWCGRDISHKNSDARHCDTKCRVYAGRARDKAEPDRVAARAVENGAPGRPRRCDCWPNPLVLEPGHCSKCGHALVFELAEWLYDPAPSSRQLVVHGSPPRKPRYGDRKRRPPTERFDPSIIRTGAAA
jgi:hypothetical protein